MEVTIASCTLESSRCGPVTLLPGYPAQQYWYLVLGTWYLVLGTGYPAHKLVRIGKRQEEEMKGGGGWILASATTTTTITAGEADTCGGFQLTVTAE